jgi:glutaconate CoA-transferase subunit A
MLMQNKIKTIAEAAALVADGDTLALGGMTMYRRPVAFARALIKRPMPPRDLTLLAFTGGLAADMLVGAGLVRYTRTCYFGLEAFGLAPMFTDAVHTGRVTVIEESEASIANGLRATAAGVGFMPSRAWQGTDMLNARPDVHTITDPYTGRQLTAFPALHVDVVAIHVLRADAYGNAVLGGNPTIDVELAQIAPRIILTAEKVVDHLDGPVDIIGLPVSAVVEAPKGAWPTSCYPEYPLDGQAVLAYLAACRNGSFADFVQGLQP